jgi:hypothetical protein
MQPEQYGLRDQLLVALAQSGGWLLAAARMQRSRDHHAAQICLDAVRMIRAVDDEIVRSPLPLNPELAQTIMDLSERLLLLAKTTASDAVSETLRIESRRLQLTVVTIGAALGPDRRFRFTVT